ncbi:MAG TPA: MgtC/SapB family protein [Prosthecobacter sp.]|nr:MgtC/SapB family protein [Prosthecobacter sp.]
MDFAFAQQLIVSLGLGMLIGLQRERSGSTVAGIRTFPLVTLFGTVSAQLAQTYGGLVLAAGLVALTALIFIPNLPKLKSGEINGMTTEIAILLLYALGAFLVTGPMLLVVATGGAVALLLHWKQSLHRFARAIGEADMQAIMRFVLISMVILPVLPREDYGPYQVLNPFEIWLMVVLIVGMSLCGYLAYKLFGARGGVVLAGMLGGVISSTATTVSSARRVRDAPAGAGLAAFLIMVASTVAMLRVLVEIGLVAPRTFTAMALPLAALFGAMVVIATAVYFLTPKSRATNPAQGNPAELKPAIIFALIYAGIKLAVAAAKDHFGSSGLYAIATLSGLADMDAITLSTARLVDGQGLDTNTGWRMIMVASLANLVFKAGAVAVLGGAALFGRIAVIFGATLAAGGLILWLWP